MPNSFTLHIPYTMSPEELIRIMVNNLNLETEIFRFQGKSAKPEGYLFFNLYHRSLGVIMEFSPVDVNQYARILEVQESETGWLDCNFIIYDFEVEREVEIYITRFLGAYLSVYPDDCFFTSGIFDYALMIRKEGSVTIDEDIFWTPENIKALGVPVEKKLHPDLNI